MLFYYLLFATDLEQIGKLQCLEEQNLKQTMPSNGDVSGSFLSINPSIKKMIMVIVIVIVIVMV